jgi:subtilisin
MKRRILIFLLFPIIAILTLLFAETINAQVLPKRVIVTFKKNISEINQDSAISKISGKRIKRLRSVNSQVISANHSRIESLKNDPRVLRVETDAIVYTLCHRWWEKYIYSECNNPAPTFTPTPTPGNNPTNTPTPTQAPTNTPTTIPPTNTPTPTQAPTNTPTPNPESINPVTQPIPWGVDRVDADNVWSNSTADNVKVAVIDTGIDLNHPDLEDNIKGGLNTISWWRNADDDNGHGTHVAGIIAGINNMFGVVGVGPDIDLYAIKALNRNGSGYTSDIIEGIEWSVDNNIDVINMSLGTTADIQSFHDAVIAAKNAGVVIVSAAGNSGPSDNSVIYPAKYDESIAVSAINSSDGQPSWSSRGVEVDLVAPGLSIYSTYRGGGYTTISGTSMATPHVAGAVAMVLATHPGMSPAQVQIHLENYAELLPGLSAIQQGYGLVDVEKAVLNP